MTTQDKTKTPTDDGGPLYPATEPEREREYMCHPYKVRTFLDVLPIVSVAIPIMI